MENTSDDIITMKSSEAVQLWLQGKDAWNAWVKNHINWNISFEGYDFSRHRKCVTTTISFTEFKFPNGHVSFERSTFGEGDVSFVGTTFGDGNVSFEKAIFGKGDVSFKGATFGEGDVSFEGVTFGEGDVSFEGVTFGEGMVNFIRAACVGQGDFSFNNVNFGNGNLSFYFANFKSKNVWFIESIIGDGMVTFLRVVFGSVVFEDATFGDGYIDFTSAKFDEIEFTKTNFGNGAVNFSSATFNEAVCFFGAKFGNGDVSFSRAIFKDIYVGFEKVNFGNGEIAFDNVNFGNWHKCFKDATFGDGDVSFERSAFGDGNVLFDNSIFGGGQVNFVEATFGLADVSFKYVDFGNGKVSFNVKDFGMGKFYFNEIKAKSVSFEPSEQHSACCQAAFNLTDFSLRGATIDGPLNLNYLFFNCIPDLRSSKLSHHVDLEGLRVTDSRITGPWYKLWYKREKNMTASARLRRLKEISEQFKNHNQALRFKAYEMRASRWNGDSHFLSEVLDMAYSAVSNYGQSIVMPAITLAVTWGVFAFIFAILAWEKITSFWNVLYIFGFSIANCLPYVPISRSFRDEAIRDYFAGAENWVFALITLECTLSVILIFLLSLGIRNKFRL